jgi:hypothetical protein
MGKLSVVVNCFPTRTISQSFRSLRKFMLRSPNGSSTCNLQLATNSTGTDLVAATPGSAAPSSFVLKVLFDC